jgi:hypothetical protein
MYASNWLCHERKKCLYETNGQNWISYHATWVIGLENKMEVLKMAEKGWSQLPSGEDSQSRATDSTNTQRTN